MLFLAAGAMPSDQARLDHGPTTVTTGSVTRIDPPYVGPDRVVFERVHYQFDHAGGPLPGSAHVPADRFRPLAPVEVEYLPGEPSKNRIVGSVLMHNRSWLQPEAWFALVVVPGLLLLFGWLAGVFRLRHVLVHGDVSAGTVKSVAPRRWVLPETIVVTYEFRDHSSKLRSGQHWVRAHSAFGERLVHQQHTGWFEPMPVLFDRQFPQWSRMLIAAYFLYSPPDETGMDWFGE